MPGVSLGAVLAVLCLALVVVAAGVSISMSIFTGEKTLSETKDAGAAGLSECFEKGAENVHGVAQQLLARTVADMSDQIYSFFAQPTSMAQYMFHFVSRTPADVSTNPVWLEEHLLPVLVALARVGATKGVTVVAYVAVPISKKALLTGVLGTSKWGGAIAIYTFSCAQRMHEWCLLDAALAGREPDEVCAEEERRAYDQPLGLDDFWFLAMTMHDSETGRIGFNMSHIIHDDLTWDGRLSGRPCKYPGGVVSNEALGDQDCFVQHGACAAPTGLTGDANSTQVASVREVPNRAFGNAAVGGVVDEANRLHWSPANTTGGQISSFVYFPVAHPALYRGDGLALFGPEVGPRVGYGLMEVGNNQITRRLRHMERPSPGSRLYSVERDPWTNVTETLTGSSHGKTWTGRVVDGHWRPKPRSVYNSTDPVIQEHALWADSAGGYAELADHQAREWRSSQGVLYWVLTGEIADGNGLLWYLSLVVPQHEVLETITRANDDIRARIRDKNVEVDKEVDRAFAVMLAVVSAAALVLIVVGVSLAVYIARPLKLLEAEMSQVAAMKLEEVDYQRPMSALSEISGMQASFLQMVSNLREYRSYMPASCLVDNADDEPEPSDPPVSDQQVLTPKAPCSPAARSADTENSPRSGRSERSSWAGFARSPRALSPRPRKGSMTAQEPFRPALGLGLVRRNGSFMSTNIIDFVQLSRQVPQSMLIDTHQQYLNALIAATTALTGIPDLFLGDRYYASFGVVRSCAQYRPNVVKCALECSRRTEEVLMDTRAMLGPGAEPSSVSVACTAGEVACGNIGVERMKRFCATGVAQSLVHVAEQQNRVYKTKIIADGAVKSEAEGVIYARLLHVIDAYKGQRVHLFDVVGQKKMLEEEWMYQLERADKADPTVPFSEAVAAAHSGRLQEACELLKNDPNTTPQHGILLRIWAEKRRMADSELAHSESR
eukprot:TRINITY_DN4501_c0_g1_i3.p1 TRINITY_DN4501_c0_g1~~TRINITY_DN4501_c0_g1_i3.p1  ORF type:complete len:950 (+),score=145.75 TRINITY_DN4501_c0_g1_i3:92-2941(+)